MMGRGAGAIPSLSSGRNWDSRAVRVAWPAAAGVVWVILFVLFYRARGEFRADRGKAHSRCKVSVPHPFRFSPAERVGHNYRRPDPFTAMLTSVRGMPCRTASRRAARNSDSTSTTPDSPRAQARKLDHGQSSGAGQSPRLTGLR